MKIDLKKNTFPALLAGGVIVLVVALLLNNISQVATTEQQALEEENKARVEDYYDEETKRFTSPVITENDGGQFRFTLQVPEGWKMGGIKVNAKEYGITLSKESHIFSLGGGGDYGPSRCVYPEDEPYPFPHESIDLYTALNTSFGLVRIGRNDIDLYAPNRAIFRACQVINEEWSTNTRLGLITYRVPFEYDENIISEMNAILQSIEYTEL